MGDGDIVLVEFWWCKYFLFGYIVNMIIYLIIKLVGLNFVKLFVCVLCVM